MPAQTTELFLLDDLEDVGRTRELAQSDLDALQAVADWIKAFVVRPQQGVFDDVLQQLAVPSYVEDGIVFGPFYKGNEGTAIYNASFRPFQSPAPFLFVRQGVISDWKFFLDNQDWLNYWAHRFGESGVHALAEELRRLPWRARRD